MENRKLFPLTVEPLIEALEHSRGFIGATQKYIKKRWNFEVPLSTIRNKIREMNCEEWLTDIRKGLAEDCLRKTILKGVQDGDTSCLFWVLNRYGHHVDFLDTQDSETESKKGWKDILDHVKATSK